MNKPHHSLEYVTAERGVVHLSKHLRLSGVRTLCGRRITKRWMYGTETDIGDQATCDVCRAKAEHLNATSG